MIFDSLFPYSQSRAACNSIRGPFSVREVKEWERDDLTQTISWIESDQEEQVKGVLIPKILVSAV